MKSLDLSRIVVPVDPDAPEESGLVLALESAAGPEHVHVVVAVSFERVAEVRMWLRTWLEAHGAPDSVRTHVAVGRPADVVLDVAAVVEANLVVLPSHGRQGVPRLLLGSVAEEVVRRAGCAVLVLRSGQRLVTAPT